MQHNGARLSSESARRRVRTSPLATQSGAAAHPPRTLGPRAPSLTPAHPTPSPPQPLLASRELPPSPCPPPHAGRQGRAYRSVIFELEVDVGASLAQQLRVFGVPRRRQGEERRLLRQLHQPIPHEREQSITPSTQHPDLICALFLCESRTR